MKRDIIRKIQDYRSIKWNAFSGSSGTQGSLMKSVIEKNFYKLSSFNAHDGFYGHESVNELIVSRLLDILQIPHTNYRLVHALVEVDEQEYTTWLCVSKDYRKLGETNVSLEIFHDLMREGRELPLDFCKRMRWGRQVAETMLVDFLIGNMERHGSNTEVLMDKNGNLRLAPIFDFGYSLTQFYTRERAENVSQLDVMRDVPVANYIGTSSLFRNLELMPERIKIPPLLPEHRAEILRGLDGILSQEHLDKTWEMISRRYAYYEAL